MLIPYILLTEDVTEIRFEPLTIALILIVGVIHTGLVYLLYFGSMEHLSAQAVAVLSYIDPVVAILASFVFLGEAISVMVVLAA